MQPKVVLVGFLDTKLAEHQYLRERLIQHGCEVITLDVSLRAGTKAPPWVTYTAEHISSSASSPVRNHSELEGMKRTDALRVMTDGVLNTLHTLLKSQDSVPGNFPQVHALIGLGGSTSTSFVCSIFTSSALQLPFGFPKVCITTMASGNVSTYIGDSNLILIPTIADISGYLNFVTRNTLQNAAGAISGMATLQLSRAQERSINPAAEAVDTADSKPNPTVTIRIALTMFGLTTPCVSAVCTHLQGYHATVPADHPALETVETESQLLVAEAKKNRVPIRVRFEPIVFHATGAGGRNMEKLVRSGDISAILDLTTTELADELCGGVLTAGPNRLQAARETQMKLGKRIVQVISCGAMDMVNFSAWESVPSRYMTEEQKASRGRGDESTTGERQFFKHNDAVTLMRTNKEECKMLGKWLARKALGIETHPSLPLKFTPDKSLNTPQFANSAFLVPTRGFSGIDKASQPFFDPEADKMLLEGLKEEMTNQATIFDVEEDLITHSGLPTTKTTKTTYQYSNESIDVVEIDCNINDPPMALEAVELVLKLLGLPPNSLY